MCQSSISPAIMPNSRRSAIIDIGSNSIRLVVYQGPARAPTQLFNEKLMVGLGASLATSGQIEPKRFRRGLAALARFQALTATMELDELRCVATAAVRDAANGQDFLSAARHLGLDVELLSGAQEAEAAGYGVIAALPQADGIAADLGGGSLELVRIKDGAIVRGQSFPLGVLRIPAMRTLHGRRFRAALGKLIGDAGWPGKDHDLPLFLVGGSWRALARFHMASAHDPVPIVSGHRIPITAVPAMARKLAHADLDAIAELPGLATARVNSMPDAAELLLALTRALRSSALIVSASGLREGLLYASLPANVRAQDPLLVAVAAEGRRSARFAPHGPDIDRWIAPLFMGDDAAGARLRLAACLLTDVAASANPDFRSERAVEMALHGQWTGIEPQERQILAQTLYTATGGPGRLFPLSGGAGLGGQLKRAMWWGLAIRLAHRLSGGAGAALAQTTLLESDGAVELRLMAGASALRGEQVEKRLRQLAAAVGLDWRITDAVPA
jgi:exopolyphosphatase / guanosine-5'-triphosphate,3'-diphosphate pyrophosphatase